MNVHLFNKITEKLIENETIAAEDKELYEFGLKQAASSFLNIITTLFIGFILSMVWQSIIFMVTYIPLRSYAGGYHARTPLRCYVFSVVLTVCVLFTMRFIPQDIVLIGILLLGAGIVLFIFAPIGDKNKPLDEVEVRVFKKRMRIVLFIQMVFCGLVWVLGFTWITLCMIVSIAVASVMVMVGVVNNMLKKNSI